MGGSIVFSRYEAGRDVLTVTHGRRTLDLVALLLAGIHDSVGVATSCHTIETVQIHRSVIVGY